MCRSIPPDVLHVLHIVCHDQFPSLLKYAKPPAILRCQGRHCVTLKVRRNCQRPVLLPCAFGAKGKLEAARGHVDVDGHAVQVARAHKGDHRHDARHGLGSLSQVAFEPALHHAYLSGDHGRQVVIEERAQGTGEDPGLHPVGDLGARHVDDLLDEGLVAARADERADDLTVIGDVAQKAQRTRGRARAVRCSGRARAGWPRRWCARVSAPRSTGRPRPVR